MRHFLILASLMLISVPARAEPPAPPRSTALAVTAEIVSPLGGAGCFYQRRYLLGAVVAAGSFIAGGLMIYALQHKDRDPTIVNAVAYGVMRGIGIAGAAAPDTRPPIGLAYGFTF